MTASTPLNKYQAQYRNFFRDFPNFFISADNHDMRRIRMQGALRYSDCRKFGRS